MDHFLLTLEEQEALSGFFAFQYIHYNDRGLILRKLLDRLDAAKREREREALICQE